VSKTSIYVIAFGASAFFDVLTLIFIITGSAVAKGLWLVFLAGCFTGCIFFIARLGSGRSG